jgi:hypothetical protein
MTYRDDLAAAQARAERAMAELAQARAAADQPRIEALEAELAASRSRLLELGTPLELIHASPARRRSSTASLLLTGLGILGLLLVARCAARRAAERPPGDGLARALAPTEVQPSLPDPTPLLARMPDVETAVKQARRDARQADAAASRVAAQLAIDNRIAAARTRAVETLGAPVELVATTTAGTTITAVFSAAKATARGCTVTLSIDLASDDDAVISAVERRCTRSAP